jgi:hypothetical protein
MAAQSGPGEQPAAVHFHFPVEVEVRGPADRDVHFHFPVEVQVADSAADPHDVVALVLDRLATELGA